MSDYPKKESSLQYDNQLSEYESPGTDDVSLENIFQDPKTLEYYTKLYDAHEYECRHLLDPDLIWTKEEERKIVWKNDWYVTFWAFVMFTALNFDRGNLSQALSDNFLEDLGLTTNNYNLGLTLNLVGFICAELPSQLISKKIGADIWIPTQMCLWSIVTFSQGWLRGAGGFYATRVLLGLLQGGFICDLCLWMSYFYTSKEFTVRLSVFYIGNPMTTVWSSLLAFALLKISTKALPEGWRWLFIVEGIFTFLVGVVSYFKMPASVVQTKTWYRKKGWYSDREERILVNKILREDPSKGDMHNREPVGMRELIKTLLDYDLLPIYSIRLLIDFGTAPVSYYLTITLRKMGFSTFKTNALSIPYNVISVFTLFAVGYIAQRFKSFSLACLTIPIWYLSCLIALRYWPDAQINIWGTYALLTVMLSHASDGALTISWCSANSNAVRTRAVSAAVVNIFAQAAFLGAANVYRAADAPLYHKGNRNLIIVGFFAIAFCVAARFYYPYRNAQKEALWSKFSDEEKRVYIETTTDEGNKRLDFRFVH